MAKIKQIIIKENTFNGKTTKSYTAILDDNATGYLDSKVANDFKEGDAVSYTSEIRKNKQGKDYTILTLAKVQQSAAQTPNLPPSEPRKTLSPSMGIPPLEIFKMKGEALIRLAEVIVEVLTEGKTSDVNAIQKFNEWKVVMENAIDDIAREL